VVVGVDGSEVAERAAGWAAGEARRRHVPLRVVQVAGWASIPHQYGDSRFGPDLRPVLLRAVQSQVADAARVACEAEPGLAVEPVVLGGYPVPRLLDEARSAQLMVIGDRGLGGVAGLLTGSVAVALAAQGTCPVVVVRGRSEPSDGPVVVGVDGTPVSEAALAAAFEAADARSVPLVAVHAWRDLYLDPTVPTPAEPYAPQPQGWVELAERVAGWCGKYPDLPVRRVVVRDAPSRVLVEQSAAAQLVVVGSRGHGGLEGLLLGSVSHAVLHRAHCPVMIVRGDLGDGR
jgi:nucleotide-binding universal stress UspA family protein